MINLLGDSVALTAGRGAEGVARIADESSREPSAHERTLARIAEPSAHERKLSRMSSSEPGAHERTLASHERLARIAESSREPGADERTLSSREPSAHELRLARIAESSRESRTQPVEGRVHVLTFPAKPARAYFAALLSGLTS